MKRCYLSCLFAAVLVVAGMANHANAGVYVGVGPIGIGVGRGYAYTPYSYQVGPPVYYNAPVLVTSQRYPYYAVPQPVVQRTYYAPPVYTQPVYSQPVVYTPPAVYSAPVTTGVYYAPARGEYKYKVKYRRGLFHDSVKYEFDYDD